MADNCRCTKETEIGILEVRVATLASSVTEIKDMVKRIEEAVGVVRIVQVHAKQQLQEFEKLTATVQELTKSVHNIEDDFRHNMTTCQVGLKQEIDALSDRENGRESSWKEKWNTFRGITLAVSTVAALLSGISMYVVKGATDIVSSNYQYILQLKTIDAVDILKKQINVPGKDSR